MTTIKNKPLRIFLAYLLAFVAINAFGGGIYGLAGAKDIPPEWLYGSPFHSYNMPALFLFVVIGGTCITASVLLFKRSHYSLLVTMLAGSLLILWIIVQVVIIGYVSWMQPAIFLTGIFILLSCLLYGNLSADQKAKIMS